jgi:Icc-related predicted phosphoesterase
MKIVALTDIHGMYDVAGRILAREPDADVLILGGDITSNGVLDDEPLDRLFRHSQVCVAVAGNMDSVCVDEALVGRGLSISGRGMLVGGVGFFGVSGSPHSPLHTPYEISEDSILTTAEQGWSQVCGASVRIFVPHAPPANTRVDRTFLGMHVGSVSVRTFIERRQPEIVVCGHIHEAWGSVKMGNTHVLNCGAAGKGYYGVVTVENEIGVENRRLN